MKNTSLGYLEVQGLANAMVAADAMLKGALVRLVGALELNPGRITLSVEGNLAACRAAVDAGRLAIDDQGAALADLVLGRPEPELEVQTEAMAARSFARAANPVFIRNH